MKRVGLAAAAALATLSIAAATFAQAPPDTLIVTGAAGANGWDTEIELADSELGTGTSGTIWVPNAILAPCSVPDPGPNCPQGFTIPPRGTVRIRLSDRIPFSGPVTFLVNTITEQPVPILHARVVNTANPSLSAELPVFRYSFLTPRTFPVLVFPGVRRQPGVYSNLILQNLGDPTPADALVEVLGPDGQLLGSETVTLPREAFGAFTIVDVAKHFGVADLDGGQVRVTQRSGLVIWGVLATVYADGRLAVVGGANP